jgi:hypothetical protein
VFRSFEITTGSVAPEDGSGTLSTATTRSVSVPATPAGYLDPRRAATTELLLLAQSSRR